MPLSFFIRTSKILRKPNVFFLGLQSQNVHIMFLFAMKYSYLLRQKSLPTLVILSNFSRATEGDSLHARHKFWCLIMASPKLMQYLLKIFFYKKYQSWLF